MLSPFRQFLQRLIRIPEPVAIETTPTSEIAEDASIIDSQQNLEEHIPPDAVETGEPQVLRPASNAISSPAADCAIDAPSVADDEPKLDRLSPGDHSIQFTPALEISTDDDFIDKSEGQRSESFPDSYALQAWPVPAADDPHEAAVARHLDLPADAPSGDVDRAAGSGDRFDSEPLASSSREATGFSPEPFPEGTDSPSGLDKNRASNAERIERLLEAFEQSGHDQVQARTLDRLEEALRRLLASQHDLARFAERLDQLETAHLLRGRL